LAAAQETLNHKRELARRGAATSAEAAAAAEQVHELEALRRAEQARSDELRAHDSRSEVRVAEGRLKEAEAAQLEAQDGLEECTLKAPEAGTVLRILVGKGDTCGGQPKESAIQFVAAHPWVVRAEVAHEYASHVTADRAVQVTDEFDASQSWPAHVVRVSDWYTRRRSVVFEPGEVNDVRTLECIIKLDTAAPKLRLGQRVRVTWNAESGKRNPE
jgi:multidrug resistance efflux pump